MRNDLEKLNNIPNILGSNRNEKSKSYKIILEQKSIEVDEVLSAPPAWLIRKGIGIIFLIVLIFISISWFFKYPDSIKVQLTMTTFNMPKSISPKIDGRVYKLFVNDNQIIAKGQVLAYIECNADHEEVLRLKRLLMSVADSVNLGIVDIPFNNLRFSRLGELQPAYQTFEASYNQLQPLINNTYYKKKALLINDDILNIDYTINKNREQLQLLNDELKLAKIEYSIQEKLYQEGVISRTDYITASKTYLSKQIPVKQFEQSLILNNSQKNGKLEELLELKKNSQEVKSNFIQAFNTLNAAIDEWQTKYILIAPIAGKINFPAIVQDQQKIQIGEDLIYIIPTNDKYIGLINIPQYNLGKVRKNQKVIIKFHAFPHEEFGIVQGLVDNLLSIPGKDSTYLAKVSLPNGLTSNSKYKIPYRSGMTGTAEIIIDDKRLIERIFQRLLKIGA